MSTCMSLTKHVISRRIRMEGLSQAFVHMQWGILQTQYWSLHFGHCILGMPKNGNSSAPA